MMKGSFTPACEVVCYNGIETWPMTVECERRLRTADNRMLRRMCACGKNLKRQEVQWRIEEINRPWRNLWQNEEKYRLRWLGHVMRKPDEDLEYILYTRSPGRPYNVYMYRPTAALILSTLQLPPTASDDSCWLVALCRGLFMDILHICG